MTGGGPDLKGIRDFGQILKGISSKHEWRRRRQILKGTGISAVGAELYAPKAPTLKSITLKG